MKGWKERAVSFLHDIVKIYSPSGKEKELAEFVAKYFQETLGFEDVKLNDVWNVTARVTHGKPEVYLLGHIDTVPGPLPVRLNGSYLWGRGAVDAKAAFASFVFASYLLKKEGFGGGIVVGGLVDEEGTGRGIRSFSKEFKKPDFAVFGEPSGPNITVGYKGRVQLTLRIRTESYHASAPWLGPSAFEKAIEVYQLIKTTIKGLDRSRRPGYNSVSECVTLFRAGNAINVTPSSATFTLDIRIPPYLKAKEVVSMIKDELGSRDFKVKELEMKVDEATDAYLADVSDLLPRAFTRAIYRIIGKPAKMIKKSGTGDMNFYGNELQVKTITAGPGDPKLSHSSNEAINLDEYINYIIIIKEAMKELYDMWRGVTK
jgi:LysW-gamma-L-lysine carboxypeptidase